ncbi:MAG: hypothetical protein DRR42_17155 [Gammaproteobacteria bacterium]|nr:MAG: hypothetical protein DRR42_17155 [Gammaproteobacteria bacterium]
MSIVKTIFVSTLLLNLLPVNVAAAEPGNIYLLPHCPGDTTDEQVAAMLSSGASPLVATGEEFFGALVGAIFSAVLPKVVDKGISAIGKGLTEAAQEKQVDSLSSGDHLYIWAPISNIAYDFRLHTRCIVVTSRSYKDDDSVDLLVALAKFPTKVRSVANGTSDIVLTATENGADLAKFLKEDYPDSEQPPAFIAVFDVELSAQKDEARLNPRFARLEHPLRRGRRGSSSRTMTLAIEIKTPDADNPFVTTKAIFKGMRAQEPYIGKKLRGVTSDWFNLPAIPEKAAGLKTGYKQAQTLRATSYLAARISAASIQAMTGDTGEPPEYGGNGNLKNDCAGEPMDFVNEWVNHKTKLGVYQLASNTKQPLTAEIATETAYVTFYDSCKKAVSAQKKIDKAQEQSLKYLARTFDIDISIIEYQNRPWVKFWGEVFSDKEVQKGVSSAIVDSIDPAKQQEAAEIKAAEKLALMKTYETARIEAEKAIIVYNSASDADKPTKFIDMESKKRTANRIADELEVALPYPSSGLWF